MPVRDVAGTFDSIVLVSLIQNTNTEPQLTMKKLNDEMLQGIERHVGGRCNEKTKVLLQESVVRGPLGMKRLYQRFRHLFGFAVIIEMGTGR